MLHSDPPFLTRHQWLGRLPAPAIAAALGVGVLGKTSAAGAQAAPVSSADLCARFYNVRNYGAKGDGTTLDTVAFQSAIDACNSDGGGTVLVPAGSFVIGTVEIRSNVTLHIAAAAKALGSGDGKHYHAVTAIPLSGDSTLEDGNWALFFAVDAKNVTIEGPGTINGQGACFTHPFAARHLRAASAVFAVLTRSLLIAAKPDRPKSVSARLCLPQYPRHPEQARPHGWLVHPRPRQREQRRLPLDQRRIRYCFQLHRPLPGRWLRPFWKLQVRDRHQLGLRHAVVCVPLRRWCCREHHWLQLRPLRGLRLPD